jgi:hypothetical protein
MKNLTKAIAFSMGAIFLNSLNAQYHKQQENHGDKKFVFGIMGGSALEVAFSHPVETKLLVAIAPTISFHTSASAHFLQYEITQNEIWFNNGVVIDRDLLFSFFIHQPLSELKSHIFGCSVEKIIHPKKFFFGEEGLGEIILFIDIGLNQKYTKEKSKGFTETHPFGALGAFLYFDIGRSFK